jgi:RNA polymerase sigma-70 factor, ECF subfamily
MLPSVQDPSTDQHLARRTRDGSMDALGALYERHAPMLHRLAYGLLGSAEDAEDLVQDLFVGLPEALRRYEERGRLDGWLRTVAARMALMRIRARNRTQPLTPDASAPRTSPPEDRLAARVTLDAALSGLSDTLRVVFVLKEVEGYSHAEIADMLGIREGTSEVRLHRATRALRTLLRRS